MQLTDEFLGFKYNLTLVVNAGYTMFSIGSKTSLSSPSTPGFRSKSKLTARGTPSSFNAFVSPSVKKSLGSN